MKKQKLGLEALKVKSFVTVNDESLAETVKGGRKLITENPTMPTPQTYCFVCDVTY